MSYVDGFLVAAPTENKDAYRDFAIQAWPLFHEFGATRMVEGWGDDVPHGKLNDYYGAVQAKEDETVLFSWVEYPDKTTRDAAGKKMMADPRMEAMGEMPFDGKRMIYSGFALLHEEGPGGQPGYVDGVVLPVPTANKEQYHVYCRTLDPLFIEKGALRVVDTWGDDLMEGKQTDFHRAVLREEGETVVFSWIEWPSKEVRDAGWEALMQDPRLKIAQPFDGKRLMYGGFVPVVDVA
jgi:uncharacterized protein YbaA (DUF1428 family)